MPAATSRLSGVPRRYLLDFVAYLILFVAAAWRAPNDAGRWIGAGIAVPSFALWLLARWQLGRSFTLGAEARELVTHGLYARIRHPVYVFSTLVLVGTAICLRNIFFDAYVAAVVVLQLYRIRREDAVLLQQFGDRYRAYRRATWF
ncbi:MAG TPA: isoprenylcysteine carboxylmethyltransferase family protein [Polyangia bacterium]|jgi:protein-S-isoprenylcysteine O-methyltransferase Ste14|nr:isoprenylcysteine carboxylmethyltransferase family protein [Polyangia bacterium]